MIPPCWNHWESFSLRTAFRSYDPSSNCLTGPICAVQRPDPHHLFLPETLCPWESFSPLYKSGDIRLTDIEDVPKAVSCYSLISFYPSTRPLSSYLLSPNKHLLRWHHVPDAEPQAPQRGSVKMCSLISKKSEHGEQSHDSSLPRPENHQGVDQTRRGQGLKNSLPGGKLEAWHGSLSKKTGIEIPLKR